MAEKPIPDTGRAQALALRVLGAVMLQSGKRAVRIKGRRAPGVVCQLALNRAVTRDALLEALWPDQEDTDLAAHDLEGVMHRIRLRAAEAGWAGPLVFFTNGAYRLDDAVTSDVEEFVRLVRQAAAAQAGDPQRAASDYAAALDLYQGPLGRACPGVDREREQLRAEFLRTAVWLGERRESDGDAEGGLEAAHRALREDPTHEVACRLGMRCAASMGNRRHAQRLFLATEVALRTELDAQMEPETRALLHRILHPENVSET